MLGKLLNFFDRVDLGRPRRARSCVEGTRAGEAVLLAGFGPTSLLVLSQWFTVDTSGVFCD